ncbi:NnrS family protein [Oceanibacterium hippocampi]|uniref:NnrS protein n=1 Tax=Oceanibacterium hippocampi TaxID=745714 RepID=A0A1Y5TYE8_9PROT|nr:NnrS family protein [Oceanibacterium hippocampi]SLN75759.1 NnrS protein [Oceanibacterium hippocampi]
MSAESTAGLRRSHVAAPAILTQGFRPFFLGAGLWAILAIGLWLAMLDGADPAASAFPPLSWHAHEMLYGYATAVLAGFLLTAIPNWTGRLPLSGLPLFGLVFLWLAGRVVFQISDWLGAGPTALVDLAFPVALVLVVGREILAGRNWRNLPMVVALLVLLIGNLAMHLEAAGVMDLEGAGWRLGLAVFTLLIALVGGRIVPSFTRNWLAKRAGSALPAPFGIVDKAALATTILAMALFVAIPGSPVFGWLAIVAALAQVARVARWQGKATGPEALLWVLHVGYLWIPVGLLLLGLAAILSAVPQSAGLHALAVGAVGTMTLAVMTRATLGHSGRPLTAGRGTIVVYVAILLAAVTRVGAALLPDAYDLLLAVAGCAWIVAFLGFVVLYGPLFVTRRKA